MKTHSYWLDTTPALESTDPPAVLPALVDVAIVGAGFSGLAAAKRLAAAGASVVVVDRGHVGSGASSRNAGQVLTGLRLEPAALVARYGETQARRLFELSLTAIDFLERTITDDAIACDLERTGHLVAACTTSHFSALKHEQALLARVFGHAVQIVDAARQRSEIGSAAYHGLLVDERSTGLNPAQYVAGLAAAATRAGARIITGVTVLGARRSSNAWQLSTSAGELTARDVLFTTDAYTDRAAPALQRRLIPVGSFIIVTEPLETAVAAAILPRRRMAFDSRHFLHYFRLTPDRRLLFGGRAAFAQVSPAINAKAAAVLMRDMVAVFPQLRETRIEYSWSGTVAFARDQMPRAGRLDGLWYAGGYAGHGVALATYLGDQIARRIAGEILDQPLFDDNWPPIPFYSGRPWFLPLIGAYYQVRDAMRL